MSIDRRRFLGSAALGAGSFALACAPGSKAQAAASTPAGGDLPEVIRSLKPMTAGVVPITVDERKARIAKAQRLMAEQKIDEIGRAHV